MTDHAVAPLLERCGAPPSLATAVTAALGPGAAEAVATDPWRLLEVPGVRPEAADAAAVALGVRDDLLRGAGLLVWHLRRAAAAGHTWLPASVLGPALSGHGVGDLAATVTRAADDGRAVVAEDAAGRPVGACLPALAYAEDGLAEGLQRLAATGEPLGEVLPGAVTAVVAPYGSQRRSFVGEVEQAATAAGLRTARASGTDLRRHARVLAAADVAVVEDAEALDVPAAAALVDSLPEGARLVLVGDPALLGPAGPGQVLADVVGSGTLPVLERPVVRSSPLPRLVAAVRGGVLPPVDDPTREVVVVPATDATAVRRTVQLVCDSIPRALGIAPADVLVVAPRQGGTAGVDALAPALAGTPAPPPRTVHAARGQRAAAAVVVLPAEAAGSVDRALVATAFSVPRRHLSVVHAAGPALAEAVARVPGRPRRTRLATLLRDGS